LSSLRENETESKTYNPAIQHLGVAEQIGLL